MRATATITTSRWPRVLAFLRTWTPDTASAAELRAIRGHLRGLGAELVVIADGGAWRFRPDDIIVTATRAAPAIAGPLAADHLAATTELGARYGIPAGEDAVLVTDHAGVLRFQHHPMTAPTLAAALDAASEAVLTRIPSTFTRREWVSDCLIAGFAFAVFASCKTERHRAPAPEVRAPEQPPRSR